MMLAGKYFTAQQVVYLRICITARYEYPFLSHSVFAIPHYGNSMSRVFAADANNLRQHFGANVLKPNKAYSSNRVPVVQLGSEP